MSQQLAHLRESYNGDSYSNILAPNIQHINRIDNTLVDMLSRLPSANIDRDKSSTMNDSRQANELFTFNNDEDDNVNSPLAIPLFQREQQKNLSQRYSKIKVDLTKGEYKKEDINGVDIIFHKRHIYMYQNIYVDVHSFCIISIQITCKMIDYPIQSKIIILEGCYKPSKAVFQQL